MDPRWVETSILVNAVYIKQANPSDYIWRRIQVSEQQAERQKKSILQLCLAFHGRTDQIVKELGCSRLPALPFTLEGFPKKSFLLTVKFQENLV